MDMKTPAIELEKVSKSYPNAAALRKVDLRVMPGEFLAIAGKSGSGKSTLLNMVSGIDDPSSGRVSIRGEAIAGMDESAKARLRAREIGIVFQFFQLVPTLSALENVMLPMSFSSTIPRKGRRARAGELLDRMGLSERAGHFPSQLSGGEQQRVAIARSLANDPRIVIADEPTGNLDSATAEDVFRLLGALASEGRTVLIVTHDRDFAARAGRSVTLADGRVAG